MRGYTVSILLALSISCLYAMKVEDLVNPWPGCPLGVQGPSDDVKLEVPDNCNQFIHCESYGRPQLKHCAPSEPELVYDRTYGKCVWPWESSRDCSGAPPASSTSATEDPCNTSSEPTTPKPTTAEPTTPKPTTPEPTTPKPTTPEPTTPKPTTPEPTTPKPTTPEPTTPKPTTPEPTTPKPTTPEPTTPEPTTTSCPLITCPPIPTVSCPTCEVVTCPEVTCPTCPPPEECPATPNGCDTFFYEHEKSCRKYYECKPQERLCPSELHFNAKLKMCDKPKNANCKNKKIMYDLSLLMKNDPSMSIYNDGSEPFPGCPEKMDENSKAVLLEIKNDCEHYMLCVGGGKGIRKECAPPLVFDQKKGVCIFKRDSERTDC